MKIIHFLLALSLSLGPAIQAQSQQPPQKPKRSVPTPKPSRATLTSLQSPFDPAVSKLLPKFQGHDPEQIYLAIERRKRTLAKGEFESTDAYTKRLEALTVAPLLGGLRQDSMLAFVLAVDPKYDADTATFLLARRQSHIGFIPKHSSKDEVAVTLMVDTIRSHEKEVRQNAYGATVNVEVTDLNEFLGMMQPNARVFGATGTEITISIPPEQAPTIKPNLALLLVCRLISLDTLSGFYQPGGPATIGNPRETTILQRFLQIEPIEVWAINRQTGDVYGKLKP